MGPQWTLVSIVCTVPGDPTAYPGTGFPVVVSQTTNCIITNKRVKTTPGQSTVQTAKALLWDSIIITGISPGTNPATSVTFRAYSDASCTAQIGGDIVASLVYSNGGTRGDATTLGTSGIQGTGRYDDLLARHLPGRRPQQRLHDRMRSGVDHGDLQVRPVAAETDGKTQTGAGPTRPAPLRRLSHSDSRTTTVCLGAEEMSRQASPEFPLPSFSGDRP